MVINKTTIHQLEDVADTIKKLVATKNQAIAKKRRYTNDDLSAELQSCKNITARIVEMLNNLHLSCDNIEFSDDFFA
jgi:Na+/phosphate symporter